MRILVDTNVLIRIADSSQADHQIAYSAAQSLEANGHELFLVPQLIYEFWSVATRSVASNGLGKSAAYVDGMIARFCRLFRLLRDERAIYETWLHLVSSHGVSGVKSFDTRLAAAMMRHNITHLLTFNPGDFRRYSHVSILAPASVVTNVP